MANWHQVYERTQRDIWGYMIPGGIGFLVFDAYLKGKSCNYFSSCWQKFISPSQETLLSQVFSGKFQSILAVLVIGFVAGRLFSAAAGVFCRLPIVRCFLSWDGVYTRITNSNQTGTLQDLKNALNNNSYPPDSPIGILAQYGFQEQKEQFLRRIGPKILFESNPSLYWQYIDRPNTLRHILYTLLGFLVVLFVFHTAFIFADTNMWIQNRAELIGLLGGILLISFFVYRMMVYQMRVELETVFSYLILNQSGPELDQPRQGGSL